MTFRKGDGSVFDDAITVSTNDKILIDHNGVIQTVTMGTMTQALNFATSASVVQYVGDYVSAYSSVLTAALSVIYQTKSSCTEFVTSASADSRYLTQESAATLAVSVTSAELVTYVGNYVGAFSSVLNANISATYLTKSSSDVFVTSASLITTLANYVSATDATQNAGIALIFQTKSSCTEFVTSASVSTFVSHWTLDRIVQACATVTFTVPVKIQKEVNDVSVFQTDFASVPSTIYFETVASCTADSQVVFAGLRSRAIWRGSKAIVGVGHPIAFLGQLDNQSTSIVSQAFGLEARVDLTGTGGFNYVGLFKPAIQDDSAAAGNASVIVCYDEPDLSNHAHVSTYFAKTSWPNMPFQFRGQMIDGFTMNEYAPASHPGLAVNRYYFPNNYFGESSASIPRGLLIAAPPINIPARTTVTRMGTFVVVTAIGCSAKFGLYTMRNGVPTSLVGQFSSASCGVSGAIEAQGSVIVEAGSYFPAVQFVGGARDPKVDLMTFVNSYLTQIYGNSGPAASATAVEDWLYVANTGNLPSSFGTATRLLVGGVPKIWIRKT